MNDEVLLTEYNRRVEAKKKQLADLEVDRGIILTDEKEKIRKLKKQVIDASKLILEYRDKGLLTEVKNNLIKVERLQRLLGEYIKSLETQYKETITNKYFYIKEIEDLLVEISADEKLLDDIHNLKSFTDYKVRKEREAIIIKDGCLTRVRE